MHRAPWTRLSTATLLTECTDAEAEHIGETTFAAQLVRLGDIAGNSAASAELLAGRIAEIEGRLTGLAEELSMRREELGRLEAELERHRVWLRRVEGLMSWRATGPPRAAKRRLVSARRP